MKYELTRTGLVRRRNHFLLRWSARLFLATGVLLLGYCGVVLLDAKVYQARQLSIFRQQVAESSLSAGDAGIRRVSIHLLGTGIVGQIAIARLGVAAMIMEGTTERTLRTAVGHISGTPLPGQQGNVGIAGHRDTFFRSLRHVRENDEITVQTFDASYRYRVDSIRVVDPDEMQVLDSLGGEILTLVTCYPFYLVGPSPRRFIVRAQRVFQ